MVRRFAVNTRGRVPWLGYHAPATGRDDTTRTCDFFDPNEALYQAELHPVNSTFIPAEVNYRLSPVTICTADDALCDLLFNAPPRDRPRREVGHVVGLVSDVVKFQHARITLATVDAWMRKQMRQEILPIPLSIKRAVAPPVRVVSCGVLPIVS